MQIHSKPVSGDLNPHLMFELHNVHQRGSSCLYIETFFTVYDWELFFTDNCLDKIKTPLNKTDKGEINKRENFAGVNPKILKNNVLLDVTSAA